MKKLLLLLLLFPAMTFAQEEWQYEGQSTSKEKYFIRDIEKKSYGSKLTMWVKRQEIDKVLKTKKGNVTKAGGYVISKWECDCTEKTVETKISVYYDSKGNVKETDSGPFFAEPVVPDSVGEHLLIVACEKIYQ